MNPSHPTPSAVFSAAMDGRLEDIAPMTGRLAAWAAAAGVPARTIANVELMLDELITNVITHGYGGRPGPVQVAATLEPAGLVITLTDQAFAFNPLALPPPDTSLAIDEREIGGLGVHFVRRMADELSYRRMDGAQGGSNELRIVKRLA